MIFKSKMQKMLFITTVICAVVGSICWFLRDIDFFFSLGVTALTFFTHCLIRYLGGVVVTLFLPHIRPESRVFHVGEREQKLYKMLGLKRLKRFAPTYDPAEFDFSERTPEELLFNSCRAGLTHTVIAVMSFLPMIYAIPFGDLWIFVITSLLAAGVDSYFVLIQRYNRPRYLRLCEREKRRAV